MPYLKWNTIRLEVLSRSTAQSGIPFPSKTIHYYLKFKIVIRFNYSYRVGATSVTVLVSWRLSCHNEKPLEALPQQNFLTLWTNLLIVIGMMSIRLNYIVTIPHLKNKNQFSFPIWNFTSYLIILSKTLYFKILQHIVSHGKYLN